MAGTSGLPNGKPRQRDEIPGVSFGPNANARAATSTAEDMAQRMNTLAFHDDAIIAAGPSTPSAAAKAPSPQPPSVVQDDVDPEQALLDHIVSISYSNDRCKTLLTLMIRLIFPSIKKAS